MDLGEDLNEVNESERVNTVDESELMDEQDDDRHDNERYGDEHEDGEIRDDEEVLNQDAAEWRTLITMAWYADDAQAAGSVRHLRCLWDHVRAIGPQYGFYPKSEKSFLVVKPRLAGEAQDAFAGTGVIIEGNGHRDLGAVIGTEAFVEKYIDSMVDEWRQQLLCLSEIARTQPQAAHAAFTHGLRGRWSFAQRTLPTLGAHLQPLEQAIRLRFLPKLFGKDKLAMSDDLRGLLALPARLGGLGVVNPSAEAPFQHADSKEYTRPMVRLLKRSARELNLNEERQKSVLIGIRGRRQARLQAEAKNLRDRAGEDLARAIDLAQEKSASAVLSTLPLEEYGFAIKAKRDYTDYIRMRYRMRISNLPAVCSCGKSYSLDHSQMCVKGGFIHMRHDQPKKLFAEYASGVFADVEVEPPLVPVDGEVMRYRSANVQQDARSGVRVRGFWTEQRNAFFDMRVFYPFASSYRRQKLSDLHRNAEKAKKREYGQRVAEIEDADFTPMVMSSTGGMGAEMQIALKHLANKIAEKRKARYPLIVTLLRRKMAFAMMRSALVCLRGSRSRHPRWVGPLEDAELASSQLRFGADDIRL
jgi:hypothetical protein